MQFLHAIIDLGPSVMLPLIVMVLGLLLRHGIGKSVWAGLTVGVGFVGISMVISLLTETMGPAAQSMADRFGLTLTVIDVGWPGSAPMAWATTMGLLAIPIAIVVNILMLIARMTNVINVDIWNI